MNVDTLLNQAKACVHNATTMTFPESWAQGRTAFGGLSAALLYAAMKEKVASDRPLRSMTTNFVGPLLADEPFSFEVEVLREGRSASQLSARIIQNGEVAVIQQASFGNDRFSEIEVASHSTHNLIPADKLQKLPMIPNVTPNYLGNIDLAIDNGGMPYTGKTESNFGGWMRFKDAPQEITDAHLVCLVDTWPPTVLQMMKKPAPASTMNWNLEFIHPHQPIKPTDWFAYQARTRQAANGYAHVEADIWDSQGELVAISRQTVSIFG